MDGKIDSLEKQRTKKKALARIFELVKADCKDYKNAFFTLGTTADNPEIPYLRQQFKERFGAEDVLRLNLPPGIMVHAGPSVIIVSFFTE